MKYLRAWLTLCATSLGFAGTATAQVPPMGKPIKVLTDKGNLVDKAKGKAEEKKADAEAKKAAGKAHAHKHGDAAHTHADKAVEGRQGR
ncbi:MAG: hypothetical protein ACI9MR_000681 [Myxococcota bacterium]|jgi:hypothetical protein